jgi:hypothetical protein
VLPTGLATGIAVTVAVGVGAIAVGESVNPSMGDRVVASTGGTVVVGSTTGAPVVVDGPIGLLSGVPVADSVGGNPDGTVI